MKLPTLKDSSGRNSNTLFFVTQAFYAVIGIAVYSVYKGAPPDLLSIGGALMAVIAPIVARDAVKPAQQNGA